MARFAPEHVFLPEQSCGAAELCLKMRTAAISWRLLWTRRSGTFYLVVALLLALVVVARCAMISPLIFSYTERGTMFLLTRSLFAR